MLWLGIARSDDLLRGGRWTRALDDAERTRLASFHRPRRRDQFAAGRWLLRCLLSEAAGGAPAAWRLSAEPGQPAALDKPALSLSISHSGEWVAAAVADHAVGVDLERLQPRADLAGLARLVAVSLAPDCPQAALNQFYSAWTLKEAWLKQRGQGLDLARMAKLAAHPAPPGAADARVWLHVRSGFALALAAAGEPVVYDPQNHLRGAMLSYWQRVDDRAADGAAAPVVTPPARPPKRAGGAIRPGYG